MEWFVLIITYFLVVELSSEKANLLQNIVRRPIGKEITLKAGNYICGEDFVIKLSPSKNCFIK